MDWLHLGHLIFIAVWIGLILSELAMEFFSSEPHVLRITAQVHYRIDVLFEIPVIFGILITGYFLMLRVPQLTTLHYVKISAALIAITANLFCAWVVLVRKRAVPVAAQELHVVDFKRPRIGVGDLERRRGLVDGRDAPLWTLAGERQRDGPGSGPEVGHPGGPLPQQRERAFHHQLGFRARHQYRGRHL